MKTPSWLGYSIEVNFAFEIMSKSWEVQTKIRNYRPVIVQINKKRLPPIWRKRQKDFDMSEKQIKALFAITTELQKR